LKIANPYWNGVGRWRDTKEIFSALKDNVGPAHVEAAGWIDCCSRATPRVVLVSAPVERFSWAGPRRVAGQNGAGNFCGDSQLGTVVLEAFERKASRCRKREFDAAGGRRVQVAMDFVQEKARRSRC